MRLLIWLLTRLFCWLAGGPPQGALTKTGTHTLPLMAELFRMTPTSPITDCSLGDEVDDRYDEAEFLAMINGHEHDLR
jgi:hypothetical protein